MQISASSARDSTDLRMVVFVAIVKSEISWLRASWILFMRENAQIGVEIWDIRYQKTILKVHPKIPYRASTWELAPKRCQSNYPKRGESRPVIQSSITRIFRELLSRYRKIALVAHDCRGALKFLRWIGFDLASLTYFWTHSTTK